MASCRRWRFLLLLLVGAPLWRADSLAAPPTRDVQAQAMLEWLLSNDRLKPTSVELSLGAEGADDDEGASNFVVSTTRPVARGDVLFRLRSNAIWSAAAAYQDRDLGPKLRDLAGKAGPGFGIVALSGVLAAERVRRYRSVEGQGNAPESIGFSVPSKWGAFARWLWSSHDERDSTFEESLMSTVLQGVNLILPLLDVAARRAWTSAAADDAEATAAFLSDEWARKAMFDDGSALSWSRGDLERVAMDSFGLVLERQKPPPPFLLSGVGSLIPEPFLDQNNNSPDTWPGGESLALVPMVDNLCCGDGTVANAVLGSPPQGQRTNEGDCLWCVANRDLEVGERVVSSNPWVT